MKRQAYLRRARHWIANRGLLGFLHEVRYRLRLRLSGKPAPGQANSSTQPHPFDLAYGTDTGGLFWGESLEAPATGSTAYWATGYYGISPHAFTAAVSRLSLDWPQFSFVDIGCGKGRAILLASRFPFRRILGVELAPALAAVAETNLHRFNAPWRQRDTPLAVFVGDATRFNLPPGPLLVFLYHPFAAPVMKAFLEHLQLAALAEDRPIVLLYANPELADLLEATPGLHRLWKDIFALTAEEGAADRFGSWGEVFSAYRVEPRTPASRSRQIR